MGETAGELTQQIVVERHELGRNLHELETRARQLGDWRAHYRHHPALLLGLALGGGAVLGAMTARRRSAPDDGAPHTHAGAREPESRASRQLEETWRHLSDTLMGLASAEVMDFVGRIVPGFNDQADRHPPGVR
jgi:hypothetical protein